MLMKRTIFHVIYVTKTNRNFFTFLDPWLQFFVCLWGLCRSSSSVSSRRASFDNTRPALVLRGGHVNTEQIYEQINEVLERRCRVLDMASTVNKSMCNITRNSSLQTSLTNEKDEGKSGIQMKYCGSFGIVDLSCNGSSDFNSSLHVHPRSRSSKGFEPTDLPFRCEKRAAAESFGLAASECEGPGSRQYPESEPHQNCDGRGVTTLCFLDSVGTCSVHADGWCCRTRARGSGRRRIPAETAAILGKARPVGSCCCALHDIELCCPAGPHRPPGRF